MTDKQSNPSSDCRSTRRPFLKTIGASAIVGGLAGCLGSITGGSNDGVEMTLASAFAENHVLIEGAAQGFKEIVEEESDGDITVDISPGGAYGAEDEISELTAEGGVDGHSQGTFPFLQYSPEYFFFANPFVVEDHDHILRLHESDLMDAAYDQIIENGNQRPVGKMVNRGARHLCTQEETGPANNPNDIEDLDTRVPEIPPWVDIWSAIGINPTPIAWTEVYSALQQGTAKSVEAPAGALNSAQLYEVIDIINITSHQITTGNIYVNEDFYQGLDETHQELVQDAGDQATEEASDLAREREQGHLETFQEEHGIEINDGVDRSSFASTAEPAISQLFDEEWAHSWEDVRNV